MTGGRDFCCKCFLLHPKPGIKCEAGASVHLGIEMVVVVALPQYPAAKAPGLSAMDHPPCHVTGSISVTRGAKSTPSQGRFLTLKTHL